MSNFHHKVQEVKIKHGVFYFCVLNFRRPTERQKFLPVNISRSTVVEHSQIHVRVYYVNMHVHVHVRRNWKLHVAIMCILQ